MCIMSAFIDLTHKRFGPNGDLFIDSRAEGSKNGMALWWVIHDIARGGCGLQRITDSRLAQLGTCPCRRGIHFKQQTIRKAQGIKGRLDPLTEQGREAIAEGNRRKKQASKLPRTADGVLMSTSTLREGGRRRKFKGTLRARNTAAVRTFREKQRAARRAIITGH
jgi:hypothetical protein